MIHHIHAAHAGNLHPCTAYASAQNSNLPTVLMPAESRPTAKPQHSWTAPSTRTSMCRSFSSGRAAGCRSTGRTCSSMSGTPCWPPAQPSPCSYAWHSSSQHPQHPLHHQSRGSRMQARVRRHSRGALTCRHCHRACGEAPQRRQRAALCV